MLDAVVDFLPSPVDLPPTQGTKPGKDEVLERKASDDEPFSALAFKIMTDPYVGKLTYLRVYSGTLEKGDTVINTTKGSRKERLGRLLLMHANNREDLDTIRTGDIIAAVGLKQVTTGDTLSAADQPIQLETLDLPRAGHPRGRRAQDQGRPGEARRKALYALSEEDPTFRVRTDEETGQTVISGMGELHLEVLVDRMLREFSRRRQRRQAPGRLPRDRPQDGRRRSRRSYVRQTGGQRPVRPRRHHPRAHRARAAATSSSTRSPAASSRKEYIQPVNQGIQEALTSGVLAGYPVVDVRVRLTYGSYHDVDSSEMAFKIAGSMAVKKAARAGQPGAARAGHGRRGRHPRGLHGRRHRRPVELGAAASRGWSSGATARSSGRLVPLADMFGYATDLRSRTQGRATYTMQFHSYAEVPDAIAKEIVAKATGA